MHLTQSYACKNRPNKANTTQSILNPIVHAATGTVNNTGGSMYKGLTLAILGQTQIILTEIITPNTTTDT